MNVQEWGCFSIFRRADDVTRTMSKGGGVLVNIFTPPPLQEILYPRLCSTYPSSDPPPPPGWLATGLILYTQVEVRVNKRTALRGGPLDTAGGGGGGFFFYKKKVCSADGADFKRFGLIT